MPTARFPDRVGRRPQGPRPGCTSESRGWLEAVRTLSRSNPRNCRVQVVGLACPARWMRAWVDPIPGGYQALGGLDPSPDPRDGGCEGQCARRNHQDPGWGPIPGCLNRQNNQEQGRRTETEDVDRFYPPLHSRNEGQAACIVLAIWPWRCSTSVMSSTPRPWSRRWSSAPSTTNS